MRPSAFLATLLATFARARRASALLLVIALASGCIRWSRQDTAMELGFAAVTAADWAQTRGITSVCAEENAMIGDCGERVPVAVYFPVTILAHAAIAAALPPRWRTAWQAIATGAEINQIWRNNANGYGVDGSVPPPPPGFEYVHHDGAARVSPGGAQVRR